MTRLFFLASQVTVGVLVSGSLATVGLGWAIEVFGLLLLLLAPLVLHFYAYFPNPIKPRLGRVLLWGAYSSALVFALLALLAPTASATIAPLRSGFVAASLSAALVLLVRRSPQVPLQVRRRRHLLVAGMIVSLTPLLFGSFLPQIIWGEPQIDYLWTFPFLALLPLAYMYALRRGELGRIDLLLNRGLVYALLSVLILGLHQLVFLGLRSFFDQAWIWSFSGAAVTLLAAALVMTFATRLQSWVDRLFYGGWYDYRTVVAAMSAELSRGQTLDQLVKQLLAVGQTMRFETAVLFWPEGEDLVVKGGVSLDTLLHEVRIPANGVLARYLRANMRFQSREQITVPLLTLPAITAVERTLLKETRLQFWLPLVSRGQLRGLLIMGERQGGEVLDEEDLDILSTLAEQAAVAADNVALLEMLRARLDQVERMRDDLAESQSRLAESREAERLHLAQELHDGPIQDLYGVRFQLGVIESELHNEAALTRLSATLSTLQEVTSVLRQTCGDLRPPTLSPFGLEMTIRSHAERVQELHPELQLQLDLMYDGQAIPDRERLALFRIYQEALANVIKHAHARWVLVHLELDAEQVILEIRDDGCGFEVPERWIDLARRGHLGMLGLAERADSINGSLEVVSAPEAGTVVRVVASLSSNLDQPIPTATPSMT
jgi:signal transduction histidine kinase